jgi:hypothetical protein
MNGTFETQTMVNLCRYGQIGHSSVTIEMF